MRVLIDTNILVRIAQPGTAACAEALAALTHLDGRGIDRFLVPQVLYEYWVVCTRPSNQNGLGYSASQTEVDIDRLKQLFLLLRDERSIYEHWQKLVVGHSVLGKTAHDTRLVAAMQRHQLSHILTFNKSDFCRYPHVSVIAPGEIIANVK